MTMADDMIPPALALEVEPFTLDELDLLVVDPAAVPDSVVATWMITDDGAAEWAMAHVAAIDTNLATLKAQRDAYIARINRWHTASVLRLGGRRGFFAAHLERYAAAFRARDPKRNKTLHLPSGVVKSSEAQPKVAIANPVALVEWVLAHMSEEDVAAVVKMEPLVSELRKRTRIVVRPIGYEVALDCGHVHHVPVQNLATGSVYSPAQLRADGMPCDQCDPDPLEGWQHRGVVAVADWDERVAVMPAVVDGVVNVVDVAGATIDPGGVTFTVVAA